MAVAINNFALTLLALNSVFVYYYPNNILEAIFSSGLFLSWRYGGFCSNMDLSDHAQILHTGVLEGEEFNEKGFSCRKLTVLEIIAFKINELP